MFTKEDKLDHISGESLKPKREINVSRLLDW